MARDGNGERALAEAGHMEGTGWATRTERRLERLEKRGQEHADVLMRLDSRVTKASELAGKRHAELLGAITAARPTLRSYRDDDDEISGVHSEDELREKARIQRRRAQEREEKLSSLEAKRFRERVAAVGSAVIAVISATAAIWQALAK